MTRSELVEQIKKKQSYLCVGLDTDLAKIPRHLLDREDPIFEFNKQIIDATKEFAVAYKPNTAFYEALGSSGWKSLQKTVDYFPEEIFSIADAKRGDIGNTSALYAKAFFEKMSFDAITVAPYMGKDSITPFFKDGKWVVVLVHTSNPGSEDFQLMESTDSNKKLFEIVIEKTQKWGSPDTMMYVVGATRADKLASIRAMAREHFFLVPGVGAQGGDLGEVSRHGFNKECGLLVNSSRAIIYSSPGEDFAERAGKEAKKIQGEMKVLLDKYL